MSLPSELAIELLIRIVATTGIVVGVTLAADRLGPKIGGALAGLPIVLGPGFFFLIREQGADFSAAAAASSLVSLSASQAFLLAYVTTARRSRAAIVAATLAWIGAVLVLPREPISPMLGLALFAAATLVARRVARHVLRPHGLRHGRGGVALLLARGVAAGVLVAIATVAANRLGPGWAGFLMTYPISLTVISVTIHQRSGADMAIATLHAIMLGIASLAAFSFTLAVAIRPFGPAPAFAAALSAGVSVTGVLTWLSARRARVAR